MSNQSATMGRMEHMHSPYFSEKKNNKKKEYEVFGSHEKQYEVFDSIRDNATIVNEQNPKHKTMPLGSSLESPSKNKKIMSSFGKNLFKKSKNPANQSENISRENEDNLKSEVKPPEREYTTIPDCTFPSPTGPVGFSAMTLENEKHYYGIGDFQYEIDIYDEIDIDKIDSSLPLELITPQKRNSLPWYCSRGKSIDEETSPPPVPMRTPISPTIRTPISPTIRGPISPIIQGPISPTVSIQAPEPMRTPVPVPVPVPVAVAVAVAVAEPTPSEPTEEYMDMESAQELREAETTPQITEIESKFETELSTQINKFESKRGCSNVVPPLRRTIHHETVHSHSLKILRDEYQDKIPQPPKRDTSLDTDDEPLFIKEEAAPLMKKKSGYELVPKFSPVKPPNKATKPKVDITKKAQVTRNESMETSDGDKKVCLVQQSKDRNMLIKILNTKPALSESNDPEPILPKSLKSSDSDVGTFSGLDTAKTEENDPKSIERNREKRINTDMNLKKHTPKPAPATGPKPRRVKSCLSLQPPDQGKKESEQKEELLSESMKFTNELQKRLQKQWNPESNYYVPEPRH